MHSEDEIKQSKKRNNFFNLKISASIFVSLAALIITFLVSVSSLEFITKAIVFIVVTVIYLICAAALFLVQSRSTEIQLPPTEIKIREISPENIFSPEIEQKLLALEEANSIFGASLKPSDMFRLVSNRINEIIPFTSSILFIADENKEKLKAQYAFGKDSSYFTNIEIRADAGLAGRAFQSKDVQIDEVLQTEKAIVPLETLQNLKSGISCPLTSNGESYGVLVLYSDLSNTYTAKSIKYLRAVGERVSPLFLNSITFERNLNNALIDSLTNLPNERAFYFILENQIAESQRLREQRPLTVLSADIKEFTKLNKTYGHATGDHILKFAAENIKEQLRQMDFLCRVAGDEFLAVLPTSSEKTSEMIIERIKKSFALKPFIIDDKEKIFIELHFGLASFISDGETANDLLKIARIKKQEAKSTINSTILWFPTERPN